MRELAFYQHHVDHSAYEDEVVVATPEPVVLETSLRVSPGVSVHHTAPRLPLASLQMKLVSTLILWY